ncbi:calcium:proton antiporter [Flavihumibacter petaseus]|uniref:Putative CaCA family transporter n=1 Tax=Flavihumibacter petaseus NBRC 106054 TaxID=1220578 RepID=A0A0E9N0V1_9BACT|nr:ionic transporter y4hA [Flavihumibacter petaseus]GAO42990.1 putative CaCA family transporter [Flavihumibacter petaseus NBRC 106054]
MAHEGILHKKFNIALPGWSVIGPFLGGILYFLSTDKPGPLLLVLMAVFLIATVLSAVHHAEVVAYKVGEPFGTLILALAVTIIEVSLIISLMLSEGAEATELARDTVFAAIMLILTGIIGICLLVGSYHHREQLYIKQGVSTSLVTLTAIAVLTMVLPNYLVTQPGPSFSSKQLIFVSITTLILYGGFISVQTVRHRNYFLADDTVADDHHDDHHTPNSATTIASLVLLLVALTFVVLLSKKLSPTIEELVLNWGAPQSIVGIIIAAIILLPEGLAALKAARKNRLQTSLNLALGSALASIGLTIPAVSIISLVFDFPITLGIDAKSTLLLILSLFTIGLSFSAGKTNILQGIVLLVILATYLFTTLVP